MKKKISYFSVPWICPNCGTDFTQSSDPDTGLVFGRQSVSCPACGYDLSDEEFVSAYAAGKKRNALYLATRGMSFSLPRIALPAEVKASFAACPQFKRKRLWSTIDLFDLAWILKGGGVDQNLLPLTCVPFEALDLLVAAGIELPLYEATVRSCEGGAQQDDALIKEIQNRSSVTSLPELLVCEKRMSIGEPSKWLRLMGGGKAVERVSEIACGIFRAISAFKEIFPKRVSARLAEFSEESKFICSRFLSSNEMLCAGADFSACPDDVKLRVFDAAKSPEFKALLVGTISIEALIDRLLSGKIGMPLSEFPYERLSDGQCLKIVTADALDYHELPDMVVERALNILASTSDHETLEMVERNPKLLLLDDIRKRIPGSELVSFLLSGQYPVVVPFPYHMLGENDWRRICGDPDFAWPLPATVDFQKAILQEEIAVFALGEMINHNAGIAKFVPTAKLKKQDLATLILLTNSEYLWKCDAAQHLPATEWYRIIAARKNMVPRKYLGTLARVADMTTNVALEILKKDSRYINYLSYDVVPTAIIIDLLVAGNEKLWDDYPFESFSTNDWIALIERSDHELPDLGKLFLSDEGGALSNEQLNSLLAKRRDLVRYVQPNRVFPTLAMEILVYQNEESFWSRYDFSKFTKEQVASIVSKVFRNVEWPKGVKDLFEPGDGAFSDDEIVGIADANIANALTLLPPRRVETFDSTKFRNMIKKVEEYSLAADILKRKFAKGGDWAFLKSSCVEDVLIAAPSMRKCIDWQELPFKSIKHLQAENQLYKEELELPQSMWFFFWKHWLITIMLVVASLYLAKAGWDAYLANIHRMEEQAKIDVFVEHINQINQRGDYGDLVSYLERVKSLSPQALKDARVSGALKNAEDWNGLHSKEVLRLEQLVSSVEAVKKVEAPAGSAIGSLRTQILAIENAQTLDATARAKITDAKDWLREYDQRQALKKRNDRFKEVLMGLLNSVEGIKDASELNDVLSNTRALTLLRIKETDPAYDANVHELCQKLPLALRARKQRFEDERNNADNHTAETPSGDDLDTLLQDLSNEAKPSVVEPVKVKSSFWDPLLEGVDK